MNDNGAVEEEEGGLEEETPVEAKSVLGEAVGGDTTSEGVAAKVPSGELGSPTVDMGRFCREGGGAVTGGDGERSLARKLQK